MGRIGEIFVKFTAKTKGLDKGIDKSEKKLKSFGGIVKKLGTSLAGVFAVSAITRWATQMVRSVIEIEAAFTKLETLVGLTNSQVEGMKDQVEALSRVSGRSTQELADALFTVTSAGLRGAEALEVLERSAKAAVIGLGDTKVIAKSLTAVIQAYGSENINAAKATETLIAIVREGNLEASELAPTLGRVIGIAAQLGISFEEVGANIATFSRLGVNSAEAVVGLRGVMNGLLSTSPDVEDALKSVGMTLAGLRQEVKEKGLAKAMVGLVEAFKGNEIGLKAVIPDVRAYATILGTAGAQSEEYLKIAKNIIKEQELLDAGFKRTSDTTKQEFTIAINSLRLTFQKLAISILPVLTELINVFTKIVSIIKNIPAPIKQAVIAFTSLRISLSAAVSGFKKLIVFVPKAIAAIRAFAIATATNPLGLLLTGISAVVAALVFFRKRTKDAQKADEDFESQISKTNEALRRREELLGSLRKSYEKLTTKELKTHLKALELVRAKQKELYEGKLILNQATLDEIQNLSDRINLITSLIAEREKETTQATDLISQKEKELEKINETVASTENEIAARNRKAIAIQNEINRLKELGTLKVEEETKESKEFGITAPGLADAERGTENMTSLMDGLGEKAFEVGNAFELFKDQVTQGLGESEAGLKDFVKETGNAARKVIRIWIAQSVAKVVSNALAKTPLPFPLNIAFGAVAGGAAAALFNSIVPSFAGGGFVPQPTLAMVGDAPGGEFVFNQSQMKSMFSGKQELTARIGFDAIYLSNKKHAEFLNRTT